MPGIGIRLAACGLLLAMALSLPAGRAEAQAVGFAPVIGGAPDGVGLNVTPVATADRRYVRLNGLNAAFTNVQGFDTATVGAAVGGGGIGGGFGLPGGGFGGVGGGGFRSVGPGAAGFGYGGYPATPYGYGATPYAPYGYGYGYGAYPAVIPYGYGGGVGYVPPEGRTTNALGSLRGGIMGAVRAPWYYP